MNVRARGRTMSFVGLTMAMVSAFDGASPYLARGLANEDLRSTVIEATQELDPRTPESLLRAARNVRNVGDPELARAYLARLEQRRLSDEEWVRLHDTFGSAFFIEFQLDPRMAPEGGRLAETALTAAARAARTPQRISQHVQSLQSDNEEVRRLALDSLRAAGDAGVAAVLEALAGDLPDLRLNRLRSALRSLAADNPEPLLAALRSTNPGLQADARRGLEGLELKRHDWFRATRFLGNQGQRSLAADAETCHRFGKEHNDAASMAIAYERAIQTSIERADRNGALSDPRWREPTRTVWYWSTQPRRGEPRLFSHPLGEWVIATQLADDLVALQPGHERSHELYLLTILAATQAAYGTEMPLAKAAPQVFGFGRQAPPERVLRVLDLAREYHVPEAAVAACELLATAEAMPVPPNLSALLRALRDPDDRVRFAALEACLALNPAGAWESSAAVWKEIQRTLATQGLRRALVIDPVVERGEALAGRLRQTGIAAVSVRNGKVALRQLRNSSDLEFVLVHNTVSRPVWTELVQQLQFDPWTRLLPKAVLYDSPPEPQPGEGTWAESVEIFPYPADDQSLTALLQRLHSNATDGASAAVRIERATKVLLWLSQKAVEPVRPLTTQFSSLEPQLIEALKIPSLREPSLACLGHIGSLTAQHVLVDQATSNNYDRRTRMQALRALDRAVTRDGVLFTTRELRSHLNQVANTAPTTDENDPLRGQVLEVWERSAARNASRP